jgi:bifunctional non-homologous end joining protein LigD
MTFPVAILRGPDLFRTWRDVRSWHEADVPARSNDVCSWGKTGRHMRSAGRPARSRGCGKRCDILAMAIVEGIRHHNEPAIRLACVRRNDGFKLDDIADRSHDRLDTKRSSSCFKGDRFVVVGFVPDGAGGLAKLRLARREGRTLVYAGRVGTGWNHKTARAVRAALAALARPTSPLSKPIKKRDTTWVEPRFDAEITYADVTDDGMVRHPSFKRLVS